jgi:hypothetical protein
MSIICLSLTPILRCNGLSPTFASTLLIPPGLAVLISTALFFTRKNDKCVRPAMISPAACAYDTFRKRLLLVGEGLAYFILAVLDFVSKVIPTIHLSLDMFKGLDVTVGLSTSFPLYRRTLISTSQAHSVTSPSHSTASSSCSWCGPPS